MKEEKAIDRIWERIGKIKEIQEIEERVQKTKEMQPEVAQLKENEKIRNVYYSMGRNPCYM